MSMIITILVLIFSIIYCQGHAGSISDGLLERIEALEQRDKVQTSRIELLEIEVENLNEANVILSHDLKATTSQLQDKTEIIDELESDMGDMKEKAGMQQAAFKSLQTDVTYLKQSNEILLKMTLTDSTSDESKEEEKSSNDEQEDESLEGGIGLFTTGARFNFTGGAMKAVENTEKMRRFVKTSNHLISEVGSKRDILKRQGKQLSESVAFHAVVTPLVLDHLGTSQNIKFDHVLLNLGSSYHNHYGIFIAPRSGLYIFSVTIATNNENFHAILVRNGQLLAGIIGPDLPSNIVQGSVTVLTQLVLGDEVWVKHIHPTDGSIWGNYYTSFCGILLVEA